ncbi:UDP-N-acetylmuramate dehydrogenase [Candidatus Dependentiae bacterium]
MEILKNTSLKYKNWFETGGNSKFYCTPKTETDFCNSLEFANKNNLKTFVLGSGANILISDHGFNGLTIKPELNQIKINDTLVTAQAGVKIKNLINYSLNNNLIGLEDFSGIPGTIGGSTYINIHYLNYFLSDFLVQAKVINKRTCKTIIVDKSWFNFSYDESKLQNKDFFLISATFKLKKVDTIQASYAKGRRDEIIKHRLRKYPNSNTCGSFFRNFKEQEIPFTINNKKIIYVAYYLDKLGIKGEFKSGNAIISYKHANMITTLSGATSTDVINLAKKIQELVIKEFGILPKAECQLIGFDKNPLL